MSISVLDVFAARERIRRSVLHTDVTGMRGPFGTFYIKLENMQYTGAFKVRGAANRILQMTEAEKACGVLAASAGNHAQGVARAAAGLGIACTIVMPESAPLSKIAATEALGAKVVLHGENYDAACAFALEMERETGATFVHPFDDDAVIAGQGTLGPEILEDVPDVKEIYVPVGGGGLISGIAVAVKQTRPDVRIIGVEPASAASMKESLERGHIVTLGMPRTIADGIAVRTPGERTFEYCRKYVDEIVTVEEDELAKTVLHLLEKGKIVSEGAGAASVAALLSGRRPLPADGKAVALLSGGNIDVTMIARIIDKGLIREGRKAIVNTKIPDRPGRLKELMALISGTGANIVSVGHDRLRPDLPVGEAAVSFELETRDREHVSLIEKKLTEAGYELL